MTAEELKPFEELLNRWSRNTAACDLKRMVDLSKETPNPKGYLRELQELIVQAREQIEGSEFYPGDLVDVPTGKAIVAYKTPSDEETYKIIRKGCDDASYVSVDLMTLIKRAQGHLVAEWRKEKS